MGAALAVPGAADALSYVDRTILPHMGPLAVRARSRGPMRLERPILGRSVDPVGALADDKPGDRAETVIDRASRALVAGIEMLGGRPSSLTTGETTLAFVAGKSGER